MTKSDKSGKMTQKHPKSGVFDPFRSRVQVYRDSIWGPPQKLAPPLPTPKTWVLSVPGVFILTDLGGIFYARDLIILDPLALGGSNSTF
jgi:hypothetical protein